MCDVLPYFCSTFSFCSSFVPFMTIYKMRILHYVKWNGGNQLCIRNDTGARCRYVLHGVNTRKCLDFLTNPFIDRYFNSTEILKLTAEGAHRFLVNEKCV